MNGLRFHLKAGREGPERVRSFPEVTQQGREKPRIPAKACLTPKVSSSYLVLCSPGSRVKLWGSTVDQDFPPTSKSYKLWTSAASVHSHLPTPSFSPAGTQSHVFALLVRLPQATSRTDRSGVGRGKSLKFAVRPTSSSAVWPWTSSLPSLDLGPPSMKTDYYFLPRRFVGCNSVI